MLILGELKTSKNAVFMNKVFFLASLLGLSFNLLAQEKDDTGPRFDFNGRSYLLTPKKNIEFRKLQKIRLGDKVLTLIDGVKAKEENFPKSLSFSSIQSQTKDQGARGSCSFFATTALLESLVKQKQNIEINLSEEYMAWEAKVKAGSFSTQEGSTADKNLQAVVSYGTMLEEDLPYQPSWFLKGLPCQGSTPGNIWGTSASCYSHKGPDAQALTRVIAADAFTPIVEKQSSSANAVKLMATYKVPVLAGLIVNPKGWRDPSGKVLMTPEMQVECSMGSASGCGGHLVLLTGYDLDKREFTFKNSWGEDWGKGGFGTISFDYIDLGKSEILVTAQLSKKLDIPTSHRLQSSVKFEKVETESSIFNLGVHFVAQQENLEKKVVKMGTRLVMVNKGVAPTDTNTEPVKYKYASSGIDSTKDVKNFLYLLADPKETSKLEAEFKFDHYDFVKDNFKSKDIYLKLSVAVIDDIQGEEVIEKKYELVTIPAN